MGKIVFLWWLLWFPSVVMAKSITGQEARHIIYSQVPWSQTPPTIHIQDFTYACIPLKKFIYMSSLVWNKTSSRYVNELQDCDDLAMGFKVDFNRYILNNTFISRPAPLMYLSGVLIRGKSTRHALNAFITDTQELIFYEPQTNRLVDPKTIIDVRLVVM